MKIPAALCLITAIATAIAWFKMCQNIEAAQAAVAEQEAEQRRVKARRQVSEDQLGRVLQRGRELTRELGGMRQQLAETKGEIQRVKDISRKRIDDDLMSRN